MAGDHTLIDPGTTPSTPVATDTDGNGDVYQRVKLTFGPDGSPADVTTANPLPISDAGGSLTVDGTVATTSAAASQADGHSATIGTTTDLSTANSLVGLLKAIKTAITGTIAVSGTFWQATQPVSAASLPLPSGAAQDSTLTGGTQKSKLVDTGGTNVASVSAAGALKVDASSVAVPITDNSGSLTVDAPVGTPAFVRLSDGAAAITTLPVSAASLPLPTGAALDATIGTTNTEIGGLTETAPATDTASSGLNGRLQRIAQRLTSLIALLPASLGQKTMANGLAVTIASDQSAVPITDNSGSLTVDNAGTFAVQDSQVLVDNAAFTDGTSKVFPGGYILDEVAGTALSENDIAAARVDSKRAQVGVIEDATTRGQRLTVSAAGAAKVDGSAVTQPTSSAAASQVDGHSATIGATSDASSASTLVGLLKNLKAALAGTLTISGTVTANAGTGTLGVNQAQVAGTTTDTNSGNKSAGTQRVVLATDQPQLTNALKVDGSGVTQPISGTVTATGTIGTELSTGLSIYSNTALSSTKQQIKASAGKVYGWMVHNPSAATAFIQIWDVASGSITVGTTAPTWTIPLPAGASANIFTDRGITHSTAINLAATTTATGSSAPATALVVSIFYI